MGVILFYKSSFPFFPFILTLYKNGPFLKNPQSTCLKKKRMSIIYENTKLHNTTVQSTSMISRRLSFQHSTLDYY